MLKKPPVSLPSSIDLGICKEVIRPGIRYQLTARVRALKLEQHVENATASQRPPSLLRGLPGRACICAKSRTMHHMNRLQDTCDAPM